MSKLSFPLVPRTAGLTRRSFLGTTAAVGVGSVLAACGAGGTTASGVSSASSGASSSGGSAASSGGGSKSTLNVLCEGGGHAELTKVGQAFTQQTGTTVNFIELPYDGLFNRVTSELSSGSLSFDVVALDAVWLPGFAAALHPLDSLFTDSVKADLFSPLVSGAQVNGKYVGMPAWTNAEIIFYRTDLFGSPAEQATFKAKFGYPLAAPKTWQQFQDAATHFTRKGLYGTDVKGAVETEWLAHVLQAGSPGVVLDGNNKVIIDNAQHVQALKFYSELANKYKVAPSGAAQVDWAAAQNLFNQGQTAMTRFWAHAFPLIPKDSPVHGKVAAAPMIGGPGGVAGVPGPWYLSAPAKGTQTDLAVKFIQFMYDHNALCVDSSLGLAARKSVLADYAKKPGYQHFAALQTTLDAKATRNRPQTPKWQQIVDTILVPTLQKSLSGNTDYAGLLASARTQVEKLVA